MTSPKKSLDSQRDSTLFGDLLHIEKQTSWMSRKLLQDIQNIKKCQLQFRGIQKEGASVSEEFRVRVAAEIKILQQKIRHHLTLTKGQYSRLAAQINQMISNHKEINGQLQLLNNRFVEYRKNVGI